MFMCAFPPTHTQHTHQIFLIDLGPFRLMKYGFLGLCKDFTSRCGPDHYIIPVRINGSAIESLFSRFKYNADRNLSAVNYETAMSWLLTANSVAQSCDYRKTELNVMGRKKWQKLCLHVSFIFVPSLMHMASIHHVGTRRRGIKRPRPGRK